MYSVVRVYVTICWLWFAPTGVYGMDYCRVNSKHILCNDTMGVNETCGELSGNVLTEEEKLEILATHNEHRNMVAQVEGQTASAMLKMKWDEELEQFSSEITNKCGNLIQLCQGCKALERFFPNLNFHMFYSSKSEAENYPWKDAIGNWIEAGKTLTKRDFQSYHHNSTYAPYTQMIWDETELLGCGKSVYRKPDSDEYERLAVCVYGPGGNVPDAPVYKEGPPCSACPEHFQCDPEYKALCEREGPYIKNENYDINDFSENPVTKTTTSTTTTTTTTITEPIVFQTEATTTAKITTTASATETTPTPRVTEQKLRDTFFEYDSAVSLSSSSLLVIQTIYVLVIHR